MGYFGMTYFDSLTHGEQAKKRNLNGTSVSDEKGTDNKANNTSAYNHDYYMKNKDKWQDNKDSKETEEEKKAEEEKKLSVDPNFDLDAAALDVIRGKYGNGQERRDALGADYEMIQKRVNEMYKEGRFGGGASNNKEDKNASKSSIPVKKKTELRAAGKMTAQQKKENAAKENAVSKKEEQRQIRKASETNNNRR